MITTSKYSCPRQSVLEPPLQGTKDCCTKWIDSEADGINMSVVPALAGQTAEEPARVSSGYTMDHLQITLSMGRFGLLLAYLTIHIVGVPLTNFV